MPIAAGTILVADPDAFGGGGGLIAVDPASGHQTALASGGNFVDPSGVAVTTSGGIVVSDRGAFGSGGLIMVDPGNGQQATLSASTAFQRPMGIAPDGSGQVVVAYLGAGEGAGKVIRVNPVNGEFHAVAATVGFLTPAGVAVDQSGSVWVADLDVSGSESVLHRIDAGDIHAVFARGEPPGAQYTGVAAEAHGRILVTSTFAGSTGRVLRFGPVGVGPQHQHLAATVAQGGELADPFGIAVESSGAILVLDRANGVIRIDRVTGKQTTVSSGGMFVGPLAICVAR